MTSEIEKEKSLVGLKICLFAISYLRPGIKLGS